MVTCKPGRAVAKPLRDEHERQPCQRMPSVGVSILKVRSRRQPNPHPRIEEGLSSS